MASGFFALLDDIATLAKMTVSSLDDVAAGAVKVSAKSSAIIIDDTAVTPQYLTKISPKREIPVVLKITKGSLINKGLIVIPIIMILSSIAPQILPFLLILGGSYLSYEGAVKFLEWFHINLHIHKHTDSSNTSDAGKTKDPETRVVRSAITTDLVLSFEIMLIALSNIHENNWVTRLMILIIVGIIMTVLVYGTVGLLIKIDDLGIHLARKDSPVLQKVGLRLVKIMPSVFNFLGIVGTLAMLWVGGHILSVNLNELGIGFIHHIIEMAVSPISVGVLSWTVDTLLSMIVGLAAGSVIAVVLYFGNKFLGAFSDISNKSEKDRIGANK